MQHILCIDDAHCKNKHYDDTQLLFVGLDGTMNHVRDACALVPSEREVHCSWFLRACAEARVPFKVSVMSDRGSGIVGAARQLGVQLNLCTQHVTRNLHCRYSTLFREEHVSIIWTMLGALDKCLFESQLVLLGIVCGKVVRTYVECIDTRV